MKDYYRILGIDQSATQDEIKKAYRKEAMQWHPDKNAGDEGAAERFKEVAEAYDTLGTIEKRKAYDSSRRGPTGEKTGRRASGFGFEDWVNNFKGDFGGGRTNQDRRRSQGRTHPTPPSTAHLDLNRGVTISFVDAFNGGEVDVEFDRNRIELSESKNFIKTTETRKITINVRLRDQFLPIVKEGNRYYAKVRVANLGNEDIHEFETIFGDRERTPIFGDLYVTIDFSMPENIQLEDRSVIQWIEIPLSKLLIEDEKIRIETIFNKKYDAQIYVPEALSNLKFVLKDSGLINQDGTYSSYVVRFKVKTPDITKLKKKDRDIFLNYLQELE